MFALFLLTSALLPLWQDVQATSVHADTRRTELIYYPSREQALSKGFRESPNYLDLNGVWDFKYFDDHNALAVPGSWDRIRVPGNWEVQGWGTPIYTNIAYDFAPDDPQPPALPEAFPAALYRRSFSLPAAWAGREGVSPGPAAFCAAAELHAAAATAISAILFMRGAVLCCAAVPAGGGAAAIASC